MNHTGVASTGSLFTALTILSFTITRVQCLMKPEVLGPSTPANLARYMPSGSQALGPFDVGEFPTPTVRRHQCDRLLAWSVGTMWGGSTPPER